MENYQNKRNQSESKRGFAAMDEEERRRIASMGGRAAHERGTAHEWDSQEAAEAGRRGGTAPRYEARYEDDEDDQDKRARSNSNSRSLSNGNRGYDDEDKESGYRSQGCN